MSYGEETGDDEDDEQGQAPLADPEEAGDEADQLKRKRSGEAPYDPPFSEFECASLQQTLFARLPIVLREKLRKNGKSRTYSTEMNRVSHYKKTIFGGLEGTDHPSTEVVLKRRHPPLSRGSNCCLPVERPLPATGGMPCLTAKMRLLLV